MTVLRGKGFLAVVTVGLACTFAPVAVADTSAEERMALFVAERTGQSVELPAATDSHSRTVAEPGGTLTTTRSVSPQRVRTAAGWVPVDTTLRSTEAGVTPAAVAVDLRLSGGGGQPLLRFAEANRSAELRWPGALPVPELDGNAARYRQAAPGVDVVAHVQADGVRLTVVATEAKSLRGLRFGLATAGVGARERDGGLEFADSAGQALFAAGPPWVRVPGGGTEPLRHKASYSKSADAVVVNMPAELGGPAELELSFTGAKPNWTMVDSGFPKVPYWNSGGPAKVGTYDAGQHRLRSFFVFDTTGLQGREVISASITGMENWAWSCRPAPVEIWRTGPVGKATTWDTQPEWLGKLASVSVAKGYNATCPAGPVTFDVSPLVVEAAAQGLPTVTVGLRAGDELDNLHWKRFENNPTLSVRLR